jgi:very-short-patch-repair endonuclease
VSPRIPIPPELGERAFGYDEGRRTGLGEGRLRGPDLDRPFHGIRVAGGETLNLAARCRAISPSLPPGSFFSSATAAMLMNVPLPRRHEDSAQIHVAVLSPHRALETSGVVGHKVQLMGEDSFEQDGLRISTPDRAWCELGVLLTVPELVAAGDWLLHYAAPLTSLEKLDDALRRYPNPKGKAKLRIAGGLLDGGSESPMESELRTHLVLGGITGMKTNWRVNANGFNYRIDVAIPDRMVAIEYQGDYHRDPAQWRLDMTRISRLEAAGWIVVQINADDLRNPVELLARIRRVLATRPHVPMR